MSRNRLRVALLFGGRSGEHEVSCVSARYIAAAMDPSRYQVIPIGITRGGGWRLPEASRRVLEGGPLELPERSFVAEGEPVALLPDPSHPEIRGVGRLDVVFPALHGPYGEDGCVQGFLETAGVPYVGSGVLGSALGMDKEKMKLLFRAHGLPTADFLVVRAHDWRAEPSRLVDEAGRLGYPVFSKPANLGSSVGITKCFDPEELQAGIEEALSHDRKVLVEEAIPGREIECALLGNEHPEASVCGEILPGRDFYDYAAKYLDTGSRTVIPADLPEEVAETVRAYSLEAFRAIDASGMARVDFFYEEAGRGVVVNEINTIPGFTAISMYPKLWEASGLAYPALIDRLIELALKRHRARPRLEEISTGERPGR